MARAECRLTVSIADDSGPFAETLTEPLHDPGRLEVVGSAGSEAAGVDAGGPTPWSSTYNRGKARE